MKDPREFVTVCMTGSWLQRCAAANRTKPEPFFFQDEMEPLDAPEWVPTGGLAVTVSGVAVVHAVPR